MDQQKLRSLVFDKTGVRIDIDDPVFALVALNEAVLEEAVERHIARIDAASHELVRQARLAGGLAPAAGGAKPVLDATNEVADEPVALAARMAGAAEAQAMPARAGAAEPATATAAAAGKVTPREWRLLAAAAGISLLSALLALGGQAALSRPAPAAALTPEQTRSLQDAATLTRAIEQLDPPTRARLRAALQK